MLAPPATMERRVRLVMGFLQSVVVAWFIGPCLTPLNSQNCDHHMMEESSEGWCVGCRKRPGRDGGRKGLPPFAQRHHLRPPDPLAEAPARSAQGCGRRQRLRAAHGVSLTG